MKRLVKEYIAKHLKKNWELDFGDIKPIIKNVHCENDIDCSEKVIVLEYFNNSETKSRNYPNGYEVYNYSPETLKHLSDQALRTHPQADMFNLRILDNKGNAFKIKPTEFEFEEIKLYYE